MFNKKDSPFRGLIESNVTDFADSLPVGLHLAYSGSSANIDTVGQPVSGYGFGYLFMVAANNVKKIIAFPFQENLHLYVKNYYSNGGWTPWAVIDAKSIQGGGLTNVRLFPSVMKGVA